MLLALSLSRHRVFNLPRTCAAAAAEVPSRSTTPSHLTGSCLSSLWWVGLLFNILPIVLPPVMHRLTSGKKKNSKVLSKQINNNKAWKKEWNMSSGKLCC